jgi:hypothetical protein
MLDEIAQPKVVGTYGKNVSVGDAPNVWIELADAGKREEDLHEK